LWTGARPGDRPVLQRRPGGQCGQAPRLFGSVNVHRVEQRAGPRRDQKTGRSGMKKLIGSTALAVVLAAGSAQAQQTTVKIGVLSDMSSLYSDIGGAGAAPPPQPPPPGLTPPTKNTKSQHLRPPHQHNTPTSRHRGP